MHQKQWNKYNKNSRPIDSKNVFSFYHRIYLAVTSRAHTFVFLSAENNASSEPRGLSRYWNATFQNDVSTNSTFSLFYLCFALCISIAIWEFLRKRNTAAFTSDEVRLSSRKSLKFTSLVCTSLSLFHRVIRDEVLS